MRLKLLILSLLFLSISLASAQTISETRGKVVDQNQKSLAWTLINQLSLKDSSLVATIFTDSTGHFELPSCNIDDFFLEISAVGYNRKYVSLENNFMEIVMTDRTLHIDEVSVQGYRKVVEKSPGQLNYFPNNSSFTKGLDGFDALRFAPLITTFSNSISMVGKGNVTIYINGRKPRISQNEVIEMLKSKSAEEIEKVEIITSPGASYSASTSGGIVNIIIKRDPNDGFKGSATTQLGYSQNKLSPYGHLSLNYSKNKIGVSVRGLYQNYNSRPETESYYQYKNTGANSINNNINDSSGEYWAVATDLTYYANSKSTLGLTFSSTLNRSESENSTTSTYYKSGIIDSTFYSLSSTNQPYYKPTISASLFYNLLTDSLGSYLDISASYLNYHTNLDVINDFQRSLRHDPLESYRNFKQRAISSYNSADFIVKYFKKINTESSLTTGFESNLIFKDDDDRYFESKENQYIENINRANLYSYRDIINAAYIEYERYWNDNFSTTFGLRAEHTSTEGDVITTSEQNKQNYIDFFPRFSASLNLAEGRDNLSFDLSSAISRPFYSELNNFAKWTSANSYTIGNINSKPLKFYFANLFYSLFNYTYIISSQLSYIDDAALDYLGLTEDNITFTTSGNYGETLMWDVNFTFNKPIINDLWNLKTTLGGSRQQSWGTLNELSVDGNNLSWNFELMNTFKLLKKNSINITTLYRYSSPIESAIKQFGERHFLAVELQKQFKFRGTLSLTLINLLNYSNEDYYDTANYYYRIRRVGMQQSFRVRYTQYFGNNRSRGARTRSSTLKSKITN